MVFANPLYLLLLLLIIPVIAWYILKQKRMQAALQVSTTQPFDKMPRTYKIYLRHFNFVLRVLAVVLLIIALARPQSTDSWQNSSTEGVDIVLALDISGSMLARDFKPDRVEAAKDVAAQFVSGREHDNIGLVIFAGESFTMCPMTTDHAVLLNLMKDVHCGMVDDGTAIGDGLATAINRIKDGPAKSKTIILLTDGTNNAGDIAPATAAQIAKSFGIHVYTIGVGTKGLAPTPVQTPYGITYQNMPVEMDEEFTNEDYAFCLKKGNTELRDKVNTALEKLQQDGTVQSIIDNYIGSEDQVGKTPYVKKDIDRSNGTLKVGTNAEFPPYEYYEDNKVTGIDMDIMQAIADELGMDMQVEDMQFDSIIAAVSSGKVDVGAAGFTVTEDRQKNVDFTDTYITTKQEIIVKDSQSGSSIGIKEKLYDNFVKDNRYMYIVKGLGNTIVITIFAVMLGIVLGFLIAIVRTSHDRNGGLAILNGICKAYLTIIRGTPVMIQLLIIYYVVLASVTNKILVAVIAFGLNSAAYVAEIVRSGIMSVDIGQFEAGRSLGLNYRQTMKLVIIPQAVKNILPALLNEFISLLKETSISGYIGMMDLTKGGDIIRSNTYEAFIPLIAVALIYLVIVMLLSHGVSKLERRLRSNER